MIEEIGLVQVRGSKRESEARFDLPLILRKEAIAIALPRLLDIERRRLRWIADSRKRDGYRKTQQVLQSDCRARCSEISRQRKQQCSLDRGGQRGVRLNLRVDRKHGPGIVGYDKRRIEECPSALAVIMLELSAEPDPVRAFLPIHIVIELIPVQVSILRRVDVISEPQRAAVDPNLSAAQTDAARI